MSLTKITYSMIAGAPVNVNDFGAVGDGVTDDTAAIQAALDTGYDVVFPSPSYLISDSLSVGSQRLIGGINEKDINRSQTIINVSGNTPCFVNAEGEPSFVIDGFFIYYGDTTPVSSTGNDQKIAFKFTQNTLWPAYIEIRNCTVRGAWYGYYDNTGTYLSKLTQVACRHTKRGFYKFGGTTIEFDTCSSSDGEQGFYVNAVLSPRLQNCSADGLTVTTSTPEKTGNFFAACMGLTIDGWDGEGNTIIGHTSSYMKFDGTTGTVQGVTGVSNILRCTTGEEVYFFYTINNSYITFQGVKLNRDPNWFIFDGNGGNCFTLQTYNFGRSTLIASDFSAPINGTPNGRFSVAGVGGDAQIHCIGSFINEDYANVFFNVADKTIQIGTKPITAASQYGGFGSEIVTVQSAGNTAIFSTTAGAGTGVSSEFVRGNDGSVCSFFRNGSNVGNINVSTGATAYVTSSDYRLKEDVKPMQNALERIAKLKPVTFKWKEDGSDAEGFLAHELAKVCPIAVQGEKDAVDEKGMPKYQGIDTSFLVALLTSAIQELKAEVDALKGN